MARRRESGRRGQWVWLLFVIAPFAFVALGLGLLWDAITFIEDAERTSGVVVDVRASQNSDDGISYTPTIRYRRADGRTFEAVTHISSSSYDYRIGSRVDILYSGDDPNEVRIDSFFSVYGIGAIFTAFGVLFIVIGLWAGRKRTAAIAGRATGGTPLPGTGPRPEVPAEPRTTDPSQPGHVHEPKPKQPSVVQRMR